MLDKGKIKASFSAAASTYEANSEVQKQVVRSLLHRFTHAAAPSAGAVIEAAFASDGYGSQNVCETVSGAALDIGCGTGAIARILQRAYPALNIYSTDIALGMVMQARQLLGKLPSARQTLCAESEALPFSDSTFKYCFSSLAYQWVDNTGRGFKEAWRVLRPDGLFVFSTLGPDTLFELGRSYALAGQYEGAKRPKAEKSTILAPYKNPKRISEELQRAGFKEINVEVERLEKSYSNMFDLLGRLKRIGAFRRVAQPNHLQDGAVETNSYGLGAKRIKEAAALYARYFSNNNGSVRATYEVIYVTAVKRL